MSDCGLCHGAGLDPFCRACLRPGELARRAGRLDDTVPFRRTRWDATDTTFGPRVKVAVTVVTVWVTMSFAWLPELLAPLRWVTVPCGALLCGLVLRSLWRPGEVALAPFTRSGESTHHAAPAGHEQGERRTGAPVAREQA